jgi:ubiquinone/menaquinone biosynthesis C-methylase UbiE
VLKPIARSYDRVMRGMEEAGLTEWRAELLAPLSGKVLEIGAGTGRSLAMYPPAVTSLTLAEPDRHMRTQLRERVAGQGRAADVIDAPAESLPFADATFDAVVSSLVLCSVRNQAPVLGEVRRVLRPGGHFVFVEHMAAEDRPRRLKWQRRIEPLWRLLAGNCHLTRSTEEAIADAGFEVVAIERASLRGAPPFIRPSIRGSATPIGHR